MIQIGDVTKRGLKGWRQDHCILSTWKMVTVKNT